MKTTTLKTAALIAAVAAGLSVTAVYAQDRGHGRGAMDFATLDANGDGAITMDEIEAMGSERFASVDADGNGVVTVEELTAMSEASLADRVTRMLERLDADNSGDLTAEEMAARGPGPERMFERLDADGDGTITEEEFETAHEGRGRHGGKHGPRGDDGDRDRG